MKTLLFFTAILCSITFATRGQTADWNTAQYGKISLKYPPNWHMTRESKGGLTRVTLTPDSMQTLVMRLVQIFELPLSGDHTYESFKEVFPASVKRVVGRIWQSQSWRKLLLKTIRRCMPKSTATSITKYME